MFNNIVKIWMTKVLTLIVGCTCFSFLNSFNALNSCLATENVDIDDIISMWENRVISDLQTYFDNQNESTVQDVENNNHLINSVCDGIRIYRRFLQNLCYNREITGPYLCASYELEEINTHGFEIPNSIIFELRMMHQEAIESNLFGDREIPYLVDCVYRTPSTSIDDENDELSDELSEELSEEL